MKVARIWTYKPTYLLCGITQPRALFSHHSINARSIRLILQSEGNECSFCGDIITDRYIFQVANRSWHSQCLRCSICHTIMDTHASCFLREDRLYCKIDYAKMFGTKCFKCCRMISPTDWVRKAKEQIYHLACFSCDSCKRQLSTGEEFGIAENRVLCKSHYVETVDGACTSSDGKL